MFVHVYLAAHGADHVPTTLLGSCGFEPGMTCRLVWDLSHNGRWAALTRDFLAAPVHLLLRLIYTVVLAFTLRALAHRLISRVAGRAEQSLLPQLRGGAAATLASGRLTTRRLARWGRGTDHGTPCTTDPELAMPSPAVKCEINGMVTRAERALIDERRKQRVRALSSILNSAASVTIFSIAGVVVLGDLGINLAPLLASAGVVGIAIGFGAQNLVRDYLSGIFMLVEDQYGVGDVITVGSATGTVETVTLRITRLRDVNGIVWHIRNGTIEQVGNESQGWARAVIDFPVPYEADLATIRDVLTQAAQALWEDPRWRPVLLDAPEVWGAQALSSTEVTMRIVVKTAPLRQWEVEREMRARMKAALDAALSESPKAD